MGKKRTWKDDLDQENWKTVRDKLKPQSSPPSVTQPKESEEVKREVSKLEPKTPNQIKYFKAIIDHPITFCSGVAGTGKTYMACGVAAQLLLENKIKKLILSRPIVECGHRLGFLPGDLHQKTDPYMEPMFEALNDFIETKTLKKYFSDGVIKSVPLETMRGKTFHNTMMILDEAQNVTKTQLKMFLTRIGKQGKAVICGDVSQSDLMHQDVNPLHWAMTLLSHQQIAKIHLMPEDIQRHGLIQYILTTLGS